LDAVGGPFPFTEVSQGTTRIEFPTPTRPAKKNDAGSHVDSQSIGVVYMNNLASKVFSGEISQVFPVGSVIVREKLPHRDAKQPELLAVMIKRERGFNLKAGDWQFLTVDGASSQVKEHKKKDACLECHESARDRDFVFQLK
jgi:Cytochrome P460